MSNEYFMCLVLDHKAKTTIIGSIVFTSCNLIVASFAKGMLHTEQQVDFCR